MADEETTLRAERLNPQLRIQLGLPAVGHHKRILLRGQRMVQVIPVVDMKTDPRLRQTTVKFTDRHRNQPRAGRRAAAERHFAVLRIVRFPQMAA